MKYEITKKDKIVVYYSDVPVQDAGDEFVGITRSRFEYRFAGCKPSKGFAPVYIYDIDKRELSALVAAPVRLEEMDPIVFHRMIVSQAISGGIWRRTMSDDEIQNAVALAGEFSNRRKKAVFFVHSMTNFRIMESALGSAQVNYRSLSEASSYESRTETFSQFTTALNDEPVVLLLTDTFANGVSLKGVTNLVHLDFPADNPALVEQRQGRIMRAPFDEAVTFYTVSTTIENQIQEALNERRRMLDDILGE